MYELIYCLKTKTTTTTTTTTTTITMKGKVIAIREKTKLPTIVCVRHE